MELIWLASLLTVGLCQFLGGWGNQDPTDPQYQQILDGLVNQQLTAIPNGFTLKSVQTQVVAGLNTRFVLENNGASCEIVYFVQSWTDTHTVTHDTCKVLASRQSRSGGFRDQNLDDPQWAELLNKLTTDYNLVDLSKSTDYKILKVETQVVAGMNYKYTLSIDGRICTIVYFEQSWTNTHQITSDTCGVKVTHTRQLVAGGAMTQDPTDPKWMALLNDLQDKFHLTDMSATSNVKIVHVSTQVVAGMITHFTLDIDGTTCTFDYFSQPWTNTREVNHDTCGIKAVVHSNHQRYLAGGWKQQNPSDQKWADLVQKLDSTYNLIDLGSANSYEIVSVKTKVVAGMNYAFTLKVNGQVCSIVYFEQSWTNTHQITSDTCGIKVTRTRQLVAGGAMTQDPTDPKWMSLLNDLQDKFHLTDMSATNDVKIVHVSTQVVAGIITHFTLDIDGTTCTFDYFSQSWTNTREVNHDTCGIKVVTHSNHQRYLAGGWKQQNPSDQKWADLVQKLDSTYNLIDLSSTNGYEIVAVKTQVVSGMNYDFTLKINGKLCDLVYYEQSWTNTKRVSVDSCGIKIPNKREVTSTCNLHAELQAVKGSTPVPGGWVSQNPSDQYWTNLLQQLDTKYNLVNTNGMNGLEIISVQTQVVAGENIGFTLKINGRQCELKLFEQSWTNTRIITCDTCGIKKQLILPTPAIPFPQHSDGGRRFANVDSLAATQQCTGAILDRINSMSNSLFRLVDNHTLKSSSQNNGHELNYHVQFEITESQCINGQDSMGKTSTTGCAPNPTSPIHSVWEANCKYSSNGIPIEVSSLNMVSQG